MLVGLLASSVLHLTLIALLPMACVNCLSTQASGHSRLDARLSKGTAPANTAGQTLAADATPSDSQSDISVAADGLGGLPNSAPAQAEPAPPPEAAETSHAQGIPAFEGLEYFSTKDLQIRPHPIRPIEPTIPDNAPSQQVRVVLRIWISPEGKVDRVATISGPADERFARSAATAFAMGRFSPGVKDGVPVGTEMTLEVVFDPEPVAESRSSAQR